MSGLSGAFEQTFRDIGLLPRLTDWIDGRIKPAMPGVYQRQYPVATAPSIMHYARWDGLRWYMTGSTPEHAAAATIESHYPQLPWRGLAEPPR